jgi:methylenetetrahydrofolate dehydrogenase (NADP+)/methenyltetrahydrofolate cyclohydrolase
LLKAIKNLNEDANIDGYIVQLPLPKHINENTVLEAIDYKKDVDGFHPTNLGLLTLNRANFVPATPKGIVELLIKSGIETEGKHCVVLGRSNIVGTPMALLMSRNAPTANCTVTLCHSKSVDLKSICKQADILIVALGKPEFITADYVKTGAVVIDVGIHRLADSTKKAGFKLVGDVDFESVKPICSAITPVPGGVGPMTVCALMMNTLIAANNK